MSFYDVMTTEYWGTPLWGWILVIVGLILIIVGIKAATGKKKESKNKAEGDVEAAKLPEGEPPKSVSPSKDYPRDAPLPPPAPSETSQNMAY